MAHPTGDSKRRRWHRPPGRQDSMADPPAAGRPAADTGGAGPKGPVVRQVPAGDDRERMVCTDCGFIHYDNPKIVVGAVCTWGDEPDPLFLLCRRAIEPRRGFWTLPAGYMELNETTEQGAAREAMEEANADIAIEALLAVYNIPRISQVQLIYRARLRDRVVTPGAESLETRLFDWDAIPWDSLAFPSVRWALGRHRDVAGRTVFPPQTRSAD